MRNRSGTAACLVVILATLASCSDKSNPAALDPGSAGLTTGLFDQGGEMTVLKRTTPLGEDESVTRTIGPAGGVIVLPRAGLTVTFPPLAVRQSTAITLVAPAGDLVGYHFSPHGMVFGLPVLAVQDLSDTNAPPLGLGLRAAYFEGALAPVLDVLEVLPLLPTSGGAAGLFRIGHFSGYVVATN